MMLFNMFNLLYVNYIQQKLGKQNISRKTG